MCDFTDFTLMISRVRVTSLLSSPSRAIDSTIFWPTLPRISLTASLRVRPTTLWPSIAVM